MKQTADGLTDQNPYLGPFGERERQAYGDALLAGVDDAVVRAVEGERAIGSRPFAATLKMERGRYRVKRGKPYYRKIRLDFG